MSICEHCKKEIKHVSDHNWLLEKGWIYTPYHPKTHKRLEVYTHIKDYYQNSKPCQRCKESAVVRQIHFDECEILHTVRALFNGRVQNVFIVSTVHGILANTDGYDDWGHYLKYAPGTHNGESYDYLDIGA